MTGRCLGETEVQFDDRSAATLRICFIDIDIASVGTSSRDANQPSPSWKRRAISGGTSKIIDAFFEPDLLLAARIVETDHFSERQAAKVRPSPCRTRNSNPESRNPGIWSFGALSPGMGEARLYQERFS